MTVFTVTLAPRQYKTDFNGNLNALVYLQWIDHARIEYLRRAGISLDACSSAAASSSWALPLGK
jgi:acyl-CoA thioesterase FadM